MVPSKIVLDRGPSPPTGRGDLGGWNSPFTAMPPISNLLWPLLLLLRDNNYKQIIMRSEINDPSAIIAPLHFNG